MNLMKTLANLDRAELEVEVLCNDILPTDVAGLANIQAMGTEELRAAVQAWIVAGDECGS